MISETTNLILGEADNKIECVVNPKKDFVEMKFGDEVAFVKMADIYALALMILKPEEADSLIPVRTTTITKYKKQHRVKVKKNINKGEEVIVNCEISVPLIVEENIKAFLKPRSKLLV